MDKHILTATHLHTEYSNYSYHIHIEWLNSGENTFFTSVVLTKSPVNLQLSLDILLLPIVQFERFEYLNIIIARNVLKKCRRGMVNAHRWYIISCSVLWQANIIVGDISEQITPCPADYPCVGFCLWLWYMHRSNTKRTVVLLWKWLQYLDCWSTIEL